MLFSRQLPLGNLVLHFIKLVQISTEKAFQDRKSSKNTCSQEAKDCASLDSPNSLLCLTEELANLVLLPTKTSFTWARARTAVAEIVGDVLFQGYFGACLCSFSSRAVGHPCLSSLGNPALLGTSRHTSPCLVALVHANIFLMTLVMD